ncbi:MAG: hypothetical protein ACRDA7_00790 [Metamycoplasmataceae bacterium]
MNTLEIKNFKKKLKKINKYKEYKEIFKNKKYRFIFFVYGDIFELRNSKVLESLESSLFTNTTKEHFEEKFIEFGNNLDERFINLNWKEFGSFVYYTFNYSNFYFEKKTNLFTKENYIELNKIKKQHYYNWLDSFYNQKNINFNNYVLKVINFST